LYVAFPDPKEWKYANVMGAVVLCRDKSRGDAFFFRIVDLKATPLIPG
jgi:hypothetical protein